MGMEPSVGRARRRLRRAPGLAIPVIAALLLTSCQASSRVEVDAYTDSGNTIRCATGQSTVGEDVDKTADGVPGNAGTEVRRDLYCTNEDPTLNAYYLLDTRVTLVKQRADGTTFTCAQGDAATTTSRGVTASRTEWCGAGKYFVIGRHGAKRTSADPVRRVNSYTPTVTVN
jgi:hypothetical protein